MLQVNSNPLEQRNRKDDEILLPAELAASGLSFAEIGVIFSLYAFATGTIPDPIANASYEAIDIIDGLRDRGIIKYLVYKNGTLDIHVDLTNGN
jgi:hypothetical protein